MTNKKNFWTNSDFGALVLRVTLGSVIFLHGFHKVMHGLGDATQNLMDGGIPGQFMFFVYISEVLAPVLIVLGILTRLSSISIVITMIIVFYVLPFPITLDEHGALTIESQLFFMFLPIAIFFIGPGRYRLYKNEGGHWLLD
jgi:putative oxidoreductase